jgi:uncharacterized membrane protein YfhO
VDGRDRQIYTAYGALRALPLEAGSHKVRFYFFPLSLITGAAISMVALLVAVVVLSSSIGRARRRGRPLPT